MKTPTPVFSCQYCEIFKKETEHVRYVVFIIAIGWLNLEIEPFFWKMLKNIEKWSNNIFGVRIFSILCMKELNAIFNIMHERVKC